MSFIEARRVIKHRAYAGERGGGRGNVVDSWDDPADVNVYGWYVTATSEPQLPNHERVKAEVLIYAPPEFSPGEHDLVEIPGIGELEVIGFVQDYNNGPFDWAPGNVVRVERVRG